MAKPRNHWTKQRCIKVAKRFSTRRVFYIGESGAYTAAWKSGWLDEACAHMNTPVRKPAGFWNNLENCRKEAKKYKTRVDFHNGSGGAYAACFKNGWLDDVCSHMRVRGNIAHRAVYVIASLDGKKAYVGLSCNARRRYAEHKTGGKPWVRAIIEQPHKLLVTALLPAEAAAAKEKKLVLKYTQLGYQVVNRIAGGALGGGRKTWTKERCSEAASTFNSVSDFRKSNPLAYAAAAKYGWLKDVCCTLEPAKPRRNNGYWTKRACRAEARKYSYRTDFAKGSGSAYTAAHSKGWLDEICKHMIARVKPKGTWTKAAVNHAAAACTTRTEFNTKHPSAYGAAKKNGWFDEVCAHMPKRACPATKMPRSLLTGAKFLGRKLG